MFWALKKAGKKQCTSVRNIEFWISHSHVVRIWFTNGGWCCLSQITWNSFTSLKTVKRVLYLGYVLLRYVLIYNLEVKKEREIEEWGTGNGDTLKAGIFWKR